MLLLIPSASLCLLCGQGSRLLLTDEYKCNNAWRQQLQSPLIQNIDMGEFCTVVFVIVPKLSLNVKTSLRRRKQHEQVSDMVTSA